MRAGFAYIFMVMVSSFLAVSPALAAPAKTCSAAGTTVAQTSAAIEQQGHDQYCDQLEDTEAISAACNQHTVYGPVMLNSVDWFNGRVYPVVATRLPSGRDNAHMQPFYQLILFPFHVFW